MSDTLTALAYLVSIVVCACTKGKAYRTKNVSGICTTQAARRQGVDTSSVIDQTCVIGPNIEVIAHVENPFICLILIQRENKLVHNFWFFAFCARGVVKK